MICVSPMKRTSCSAPRDAQKKAQMQSVFLLCSFALAEETDQMGWVKAAKMYKKNHNILKIWLRMIYMNIHVFMEM